MPYIPQEDRLRAGMELSFDNVGEQNFHFYKKMLEMWKETPRYRTIHIIYRTMVVVPRKFKTVTTGEQSARELAFMEFYRRVAAPYEDKAMKKNGDVIV